MPSYGSHPHFIDLHHWGKFERLVLQVLEQFRLRLDEFAVKTFSKIAWRWRHSKLNVSGVKVIQLTEDDLVEQLGCSRQKVKKILSELKTKKLIDWQEDANSGSLFWVADKGQGVLQELSY